MRVNKVLVFVFIVFLFTIAAEVSVYLFLQKFSVSINRRTRTENISNTAKTKTEIIINEGSLYDALKQISNISLISSTIHNQYQGKVNEIKFGQGKIPVDKNIYSKVKDGYFKNGYYEYEVILKIKREQDGETLNFYWNRSVLDKTKVFEKKNGVMRPTDLTNIKAGDSITLDEVMDLMNKNCFGYQCLQEYSLVKN